MTGRTLSGDGFATGGATPGLNSRVFPLMLTGVGHDTPALTLGDDVTEITDKPDKFRYKVEVDNTGIEEYYEYEEHKTAAEVRADWYSDVKDAWGEQLASAFKSNITVTDLWRQITVDPDSEGWQENQKESQKDKTPPLGSAENPLVMPPPEEEQTEE